MGGRCHRSTREDVVGELYIPDGRVKKLAKSPKRRTGGPDITIVQFAEPVPDPSTGPGRSPLAGQRRTAAQTT